MRAVVGGVQHDRVLGQTLLVDEVEDLADQLIVVDHRVVVLRLPPPGFAAAAVLDVGAEMHVGGVQPDEERGVSGLGVGHEPQRLRQDLVVDRLHPLLGQRAGVLDPLAAVLVRPRVDHPARAEPLPEPGQLLLGRVVVELRLLLCVQVVEIAEELVEPVRGRQELVLIAEVVLAELPGP